MRVAHVAAEIAPWCASGGLGQVMGALPEAIAATGRANVDTFFPLCPEAAELDLHEVGSLAAGGRLVRIEGGAATTYFVDAPEYFDRPSLYGDYGDPYYDEAERFAYFNRAVIEAWAMTGMPEVVHSHDWHAAAVNEFLRPVADRPATVLTIHNLSYQGVFDPATTDVGLAPIDGEGNFLASGIANADVVTTVSPTYASEIITQGAGLEGLLAKRAPVVGILNGIDHAEWNPATDPMIPVNFDADSLGSKAGSRAALADALSLDVDEDDLVVGVVSRLVEQKGIDLVIEAAADTIDAGVRLAVLGDGDPEIEAALLSLAEANPGRVALRRGWDRALAHLVVAGSDALAIPSRFEPCGLTQMQAMRYGTVPVVHGIGGLRDTVIDPGDDALGAGDGSGFRFDEPTGPALARALLRAARLHRTQGWASLQRAVMALDWSWAPAAEAYVDLYETIAGQRAAG